MTDESPPDGSASSAADDGPTVISGRNFEQEYRLDVSEPESS